ncbi:hypothetical protein HNQ51_000168 [Inhella inkyongensis]|uniref:Lipoprotein n=1 Tax=Inhella inkyongensis TaxID=392593 RepID=A0A840RY51_9BURK|nr:hypothetical protein [Inhella inkyongensis]
MTSCSQRMVLLALFASLSGCAVAKESGSMLANGANLYQEPSDGARVR